MAAQTMFVPDRLQPTTKTGVFVFVGCWVRWSLHSFSERSWPNRNTFAMSACLNRLRTRRRRMTLPPVGNVRSPRPGPLRERRKLFGAFLPTCFPPQILVAICHLSPSPRCVSSLRLMVGTGPAEVHNVLRSVSSRQPDHFEVAASDFARVDASGTRVRVGRAVPTSARASSASCGARTRIAVT